MAAVMKMILKDGNADGGLIPCAHPPLFSIAHRDSKVRQMRKGCIRNAFLKTVAALSSDLKSIDVVDIPPMLIAVKPTVMWQGEAGWI